MRASFIAPVLVFATLIACGETDGSNSDGGATGGASGSESPSGGSGGGQAGVTGGGGVFTASGGAPGSGGTSASGGISAGGQAAPEAGPVGPAGGADHDAASSTPDGAASAAYTCSLILGIVTTSEWFGGFEKVVDSARWELKFQDSAHLEKWADPANAVWSLPITSPCVENANAPERVVFMGTNYDYDTVELFLPKYIAVWNNIRAKYPSVKHLDVMTYTRGPGNKECVGADRSNDSYIKPAQDEAIAQFEAMYRGVVIAAPRWEVASCSDFTLCPHLTGPANAVISKTIGEYFLTH